MLSNHMRFNDVSERIYGNFIKVIFGGNLSLFALSLNNEFVSF